MEWLYIDDKLEKKFLSYNTDIRCDLFARLEKIINHPTERGNYASKETHNIFKIKSSSEGIQVRLFFTYYEGDIVLLHIFTKKTQKTPKKELRQAIRKYNLLY